MIDDFNKASLILKEFHQEHLLNFYDELDEDQKEYLIKQICSINFKQMIDLYENSKIDDQISSNLIKPLPYTKKANLSKNELQELNNIGADVIKQNKLAIVTLAGGQGTRLGYKGPKGSFELDTNPKKSLFEIICDYLKTANSKFNVSIPWYIMTSIYNDDDTKKFFENHNYFGYNKSLIKFFKQSQLPIIDITGNLILEETYKIKEASNGNGDVFASMENNNIINDMKEKNIDWIFFGGIDNVLLNPVDPIFLGLTIKNNTLIASKTLFKENPEDKDWIFALNDNKPSIIDCCHLTDHMKIARDLNGNYLYRDINILAHLFNIKALDIICNKKLPYHRAFKKNPYVNEEGMKQVPDYPNTFKFETFIFDAFSYFDKITLLRVEKNKEFAPIKDFNGPYNPEIAKILYEKYVMGKDI